MWGPPTQTKRLHQPVPVVQLTVPKPTQLKPVQILCVRPAQEMWQTEQERGNPHWHKTRDIHSIGEERFAPLFPMTATCNDHGLSSWELWDDIRSSRGCRNCTGTCVIATLPGPIRLAAIEGEGPRPALLFSGDNCLNLDAHRHCPPALATMGGEC